MNSAPDFSIVTPSRNSGAFLADCIRSVQEQEGATWEHIVMDAQSTDATLDILDSEPGVQWTSEPDSGMADAINKGFGRARGEWLMWLNADDILLPDTLRVVKEHAAGITSDVIYGDCAFVDADLKFIRRKRDHRFDLYTLLFYGCFISSTSCFYHRRIVDAGHLLKTEYHVCLDTEYYLRLACEGYTFAYMPKVLAHFRWHGDNASTRLDSIRRRERFAIQSACLKKLGMPHLAHRLPLAILKQAFRLKRAWLRVTPCASAPVAR